jgi:predicted ATPase/transcriptional regulator with XRE-family HTH domain
VGQAASVATVGPGELRARRHALGLTQAELADRLGVSANTVARWERGEQRVRHPQTLARILQRLEHRRLAPSGHARRVARLGRGRQSDQAPVGHRLRNGRQSDRPAPGWVRHNLPAELSSFVGRAGDIEQLVQRLGSARLVTLVGSGGVGKTRLALQVARRALDRFSDGVCLVQLASTTDGAMVPNAVAAVLGLREQPRISLLATLAAALRDQHLLLVLDNCEHLADGCAELAHLLLESCPRLSVLATSREALRAIGEIRWPVAPLPVSEALRLFVDRARAVRPEFDLTPDNADPVADVCAQLDGLPLAIELAAARTRALPVRGLHQQLRSAGGRLPLLTGGPRDAPARHRTLHAAIAWSFELLDPEEQTLFRRLAPFRGFTLDAATAVCVAPEAGPGSASVALPPVHLQPLAGLASLVDKSLLHVEEDAEGQPWFAMLETVREFALERLETSGESAAVWRRHALYYLRLVEQLEPRLQDIPQDVFVKRLQREQANCRASLDWCQAHGYAEPSLRLGLGLWWFWAVRGQLAEGRGRLEALLARFPLPPSAGARRAMLHAKALGAAGRLAMLQGDFAGARPRLEDAVRLAQDLDDAEGLSVALEGLAYLALQQADYTLARALLERRLSKTRAQARSTSPADPTATWQTATTLAELGMSRSSRETITRPRRCWRRPASSRGRSVIRRSRRCSTSAWARWRTNWATTSAPAA